MTQPEQVSRSADVRRSDSFGNMLQCQQLSMLYKDSTGYYRLGMGCALVCGTLLWNHVSALPLGIWLLVYGVLTWGGIQMNQRYHRRFSIQGADPITPQTHCPSHSPETLIRWRNLFTLGGLLIGSCWGVLITLITPHDPVLQSVVVVCMTGLALYASAVFSAILPAYLGFILPAFLPLLIFESSQSSPLISPLIISAFLAFLIYSAWRNHMLLRDSLITGAENALLLAQVREEQQATQQLNHQLENEMQERKRAQEHLQSIH